MLGSEWYRGIGAPPEMLLPECFIIGIKCSSLQSKYELSGLLYIRAPCTGAFCGGNQQWTQLHLQEAALAAAQHKDPVAQQIGAANTLVGQSDGTLAAYNTDWSAAISAIEGGLRASTEGVSVVDATPSSSGDSSSPLKGRTVLVVGAGGAGRALAFGAAEAGAKVHSVCTVLSTAQNTYLMVAALCRHASLLQLPLFPT